MAKPEIKAIVTLDRAKFQRGLAKIKWAARDFRRDFGQFAMGAAKGAAVLGAALAGAAGVGIMFAMRMGDAIAKMSDRTGMSAENLSALAHAAELTDGDLSTLGKAMKQVAQNMEDADRGLKTANDKFERLGLNVKDLKKLSPDELFDTIAEAVSKIEDPTERAGKAVSLLGRSGQKLLPLFSQGADGLKKMKDEATKLGLIITTDQAKAAAELADEFTRVKNSMKALIFNLVPMRELQSVFRRFTELVTGFRNSKQFEQISASVKSFATSAASSMYSVANTVYKAIQVWGLLDKETKSRLGNILKNTAIFAVAWKSGFLKLFSTSIMAVAKMFSGTLIPVVAASLTALAGLVVGFKIGEALEKSFDFSGLLTKLWESWSAAIAIFKNAGSVLIDLAGATWAAIESAMSGNGFDTRAFDVIIENGAKAQNAIIDGWSNTMAEIDKMGTTNGESLVTNMTAGFDDIKKRLEGTVGTALEKLADATGIGDLKKAFQAAFAEAKDLPELKLGDLEKGKNDAKQIGEEINSWNRPFRGMDRVLEKQMKNAKAAGGKGGLGRFADEGARKLFGPQAAEVQKQMRNDVEKIKLQQMSLRVQEIIAQNTKNAGRWG